MTWLLDVPAGSVVFVVGAISNRARVGLKQGNGPVTIPAWRRARGWSSRDCRPGEENVLCRGGIMMSVCGSPGLESKGSSR